LSEAAKKVPEAKGGNRGKRAIFRSQILEQILDKMTSVFIFEKDLDPKLWENYEGWVEKLVKLSTNRQFTLEEAKNEMEQFKTAMFQAIETAAANQAAEDQMKKEENKLRSAIIREISEAMDGKPMIFKRDLDSSL